MILVISADRKKRNYYFQTWQGFIVSHNDLKLNYWSHDDIACSQLKENENEIDKLLKEVAVLRYINFVLIDHVLLLKLILLHSVPFRNYSFICLFLFMTDELVLVESLCLSSSQSTRKSVARSSIITHGWTIRK